jgi:hypothetical protein
MKRIVPSLFVCIFGCTGTTDGPVADGAGRDGGSVPRRDGGGGARDASGEDAAGEDAAGEDAGALPGPGCEGRDYLLCEDFEGASGSDLPSGWTVGGGWQDGDPSTTTGEHRSGTRALASAIAMAGQHRAERSLEALGAARGEHWGRVFYKVETPFFVPSGGVVHSTLVALLASNECRVVDTVLAPDGSHQFLFNLPDDSCCTGSSYDYDTYDGEWHCAEWHVRASDQSYEFYIDGTEVEDIAFSYGGDDRAHIEEFDAIAVGWRNYQTADTPYESWFDDLAIDDERIGCE